MLMLVRAGSVEPVAGLCFGFAADPMADAQSKRPQLFHKLPFSTCNLLCFELSYFCDANRECLLLILTRGAGFMSGLSTVPPNMIDLSDVFL